jgi:hypothetical protein
LKFPRIDKVIIENYALPDIGLASGARHSVEEANQAEPLGRDQGVPCSYSSHRLSKEANHGEQLGNREGFRQVADRAAYQARFAGGGVSSSGHHDDR